MKKEWLNKIVIFFDSLHIYIKILFGKKFHYTILSNHVMIFKVDAEMSEIFADCSRENPRKIPPIDFNRSEINDIAILVQN